MTRRQDRDAAILQIQRQRQQGRQRSFRDALPHAVERDLSDLPKTSTEGWQQILAELRT